MSEKKSTTGSGLIGLGDLLRQSVAKCGGLPPAKPTRAPRPGGNRKVIQFRGGRRRD